MIKLAEILLSQIWNSRWLRDEMRTTDGRSLRIIYPGVWTHGLGPDFTDAYLDIDGELLSGAVEVHRRTSDWFAHGHHLDPAYGRVILHAVLADEPTTPAHRSDGVVPPVLQLQDWLAGSLDMFPVSPLLRPLGAIGFEHCAPDVAERRPLDLRAVWEQAGDTRMSAKVSIVSGRLAAESPAHVLYAMLLDALGYSRNREGMQRISERLPFDHLDARLLGQSRAERRHRAAGLLLGIGGFLPLTQPEAEAVGLSVAALNGIESAWHEHGAPWRDLRLPASAWNLARTRPAAHPLRRLLALSEILSACVVGLLEDACQVIHSSANESGALNWLVAENRFLGRDQAHEMIVNVLVPFMLAYGDMTGDDHLLQRASELWRGLPAGRGNAQLRKTLTLICGPHRVLAGSARAEQGLLHLHRHGCSQMRCYECPVAHLALAAEIPLDVPSHD